MSLEQFNQNYINLVSYQKQCINKEIYFNRKIFIELIDQYFSINEYVLSKEYYDDITSSIDPMFKLFDILSGQHFIYICSKWKIYHIMLCDNIRIFEIIAKNYTNESLFRWYTQEEKDYIFRSCTNEHTLLFLAVQYNRPLIKYLLENGHYMYDEYNVMITDNHIIIDHHIKYNIYKNVGIKYLIEFTNAIIFGQSLRYTWITSCIA